MLFCKLIIFVCCKKKNKLLFFFELNLQSKGNTILLTPLKMLMILICTVEQLNNQIKSRKL
jgi:hypothetical protein